MPAEPLTATVAEFFSGPRGVPTFDRGERVSAWRQGDGKYTVSRLGYEPDGQTSVVGVPGEVLEIEGCWEEGQ